MTQPRKEGVARANCRYTAALSGGKAAWNVFEPFPFWP
jgi:hypothetical protein